MNVEKLKRVAIKEFKRSPAKTGFLLLMIPVALYFCVPLLFGALKKSSPSSGAAAVAAVPQNASFVSPAATNALVTPSRVGPSWVEVSRSLDGDALAMPAGIAASARNPFAAIKRKKIDKSVAAAEGGAPDQEPNAESESAEPVEKAIAAANDPIRALGFRLTATMVGQRSRLATINGKTYEQGETISVSPDPGIAADAMATVPVTLKSVDRQFVVLEMAGHEHQLQLPNELPRDAIVVKSRPE